MPETCTACNGKGFTKPDGTPVNAFEGSDFDRVKSCSPCNGTGQLGMQFATLCPYCIDELHPQMLTGYCMTAVHCDRCNRVTDCAMVKTPVFVKA